MNHVMLDLETLGKTPGCVVLSIGAVRFGEKGVEKDGYYQVIKEATCLEAGLTADPDTLAWWERQSPEARQVLADARQNRCRSLRPVLKDFALWLGANPTVWGNGSDFDQPILAAAYWSCKLVVPWKYYNSRCYRTLKSFAPLLKARGGAAAAHNALADARAQAEHAVAICQHLNWRLP